MKTSLHLARAANLLSLGAFVIFAGCASAPLRQSTLPLETEYVSVHELDIPGYEAAAPIQTVSPRHPWELARLGIPGEVSMNLAIDETGRVVDAQVVSSTDEAFEDPALEALKKWTFKPASQNGVPVASRVNIPVKFGFND
jgi:TonB family protein